MNRILSIISPCLILAAGINTTANAALAGDARLDFNSGVSTSSVSGLISVSSGSYFGLDSNGNGVISAGERAAISQHDGLLLGTVQGASGSHGGPPDGSESPGIDNPWAFKANTGMQYSSTPTNVLTDDGNGNATVDFSGWGVTWNGISAINMGGGSQDCGTANDGICIAANGIDIGGVFDNGTGVATVTCAVDCAAGDTYVLDYTAIVPQADASNFGGILFQLHLEGTVAAVPVPAAVWLFGSGLLGLAGVARRRKV